MVFEVMAESVKKYAPVIKAVMENVVKLAVPIIAEVEVGENWGDLNTTH